jgi:hypothetical protein
VVFVAYAFSTPFIDHPRHWQFLGSCGGFRLAFIFRGTNFYMQKQKVRLTSLYQNSDVARSLSPGVIFTGAPSAVASLRPGAQPTKGSISTGPEPTEDDIPTGAQPTEGSISTGAQPTEGSISTGAQPTKGGISTGAQPTKGNIIKEIATY